jgi:hypothetical protein
MYTHTQTQTNVLEILETRNKLTNEYHQKRIDTAIDQFNLINTFYPCNISAEVNLHDNYMYLESISIFLKHDTLKIEIRFDEYRKKYNIFAHFNNMYKNISNDYRRHTEEKTQQPQKIGVLNTNKIVNWIKYYENIDTILNTKNNENVDKIQEFRNKLIGLPVTWHKDNKSGYIDKNGLCYQFNILSDGYIEQSIRITGSTNLDTFLKLTK